MTKELLTRDQIFSRFDSEWILVEDPELDANQDVVRGQVLFHSKDRDEVYRKALELRPRHSAFFYTGGIPEGTEVIL